MLSKQYRLKSSSDIKNVLANGKSTRSGFLFLKFFPNELEYSRFAFSIGVSYSKSATTRNAFKRKMRALIGKNIDQIEKGYDCVFFARRNENIRSIDSVEDLVLNCLIYAKLFKKQIK